MALFSNGIIFLLAGPNNITSSRFSDTEKNIKVAMCINHKKIKKSGTLKIKKTIVLNLVMHMFVICRCDSLMGFFFGKKIGFKIC